MAKIKKCYKYYGWLYDMIKLHLEKKFNVKLIKNKFETFGKKYKISSFSTFDDYRLDTELEMMDKNDCEIEISLVKDKKSKHVQAVNSDIKKYF